MFVNQADYELPSRIKLQNFPTICKAPSFEVASPASVDCLFLLAIVRNRRGALRDKALRARQTKKQKTPRPSWTAEPITAKASVLEL